MVRRHWFRRRVLIVGTGSRACHLRDLINEAVGSASNDLFSSVLKKGSVVVYESKAWPDGRVLRPDPGKGFGSAPATPFRQVLPLTGRWDRLSRQSLAARLTRRLTSIRAFRPPATPRASSPMEAMYGASVADAHRKLEYDLYYIKNYSVPRDLHIILQTMCVLFWPVGVR